MKENEVKGLNNSWFSVCEGGKDDKEEDTNEGNTELGGWIIEVFYLGPHLLCQ